MANVRKKAISEDQRREYKEWIMREIEYLGRYHDHKETMACVATAFYLTGIIGLAYAVRNIVNQSYYCLYIGTIVLIIFLAVLITCFLCMQFRN